MNAGGQTRYIKLKETAQEDREFEAFLAYIHGDLTKYRELYQSFLLIKT